MTNDVSGSRCASTWRLPLLAGSILFVFSANMLAQEEPSESKVTEARSADVKRVILFNSGVAHVTHGIQVNKTQTLELEIDRDQIDNVLKSMVFDSPEGTSNSVRYQPIENQSERDIKIFSSPMTIAQLLQFHRGESVTLQVDGEPCAGTIVGVETRETEEESLEFIGLLSDDGLATFALEDVERFKFDDDEIRERFANAIRGVAKSQQVDGETIELVCQGGGERDLRFAYVVDAPIWRISYRLDLNAHGEESRLQGWAHVDHVGREPWKDVQLVLQSGRPRVFRADVFLPIISSRPNLGTSVFGLEGSLMRVEDVLADAMRSASKSSEEAWKDTGELSGAMGFGGRGGSFGGGGGRGGGFGVDEDSDGVGDLDISGGFSSLADRGKVGQVVSFKIDDPVTLDTQASAMLPVFDQNLNASRETWFRVNDGSASGELILNLKNQSEYPLLAGPVAIYQAGIFLGDARLRRTEIGAEFELRYGLDEPVSLVLSRQRTRTKLTKMDLDARKRIRISGVETKTSKLTLKNQDSEPRKIVVLIPREEPNITASPDPTEATDDSFRYEFDVAAGQEKTQTLEFTLPTRNYYRVRARSRTEIAQWLESIDDISDPVRVLIDRYLELDDEIRKLNIERNRMAGKMEALVSDRERVIRLVDAMGDGGAVRQPLVDQAVNAEEQIQNLRKESTAIREKIKALELDLKQLESPE